MCRPQGKISHQLFDGVVWVSPAIKFTVMWLLMTVFSLRGGIESTDESTEGTGEEFPVNGTPVAQTPPGGDRNSLWFCTFVKVNTRAPPLPPPPPLSPTASIYHSRVTMACFTTQNGPLFNGQSTRCLPIQGFLLFVSRLFELMH